MCHQRAKNATATYPCNVIFQSALTQRAKGRKLTADGEAAIICQAGDRVVSDLLQGAPQRAHPVPLPQRCLDPLQRQEQPSWHEECLGMSLRGKPAACKGWGHHQVSDSWSATGHSLLHLHTLCAEAAGAGATAPSVSSRSAPASLQGATSESTCLLVVAVALARLHDHEDS